MERLFKIRIFTVMFFLAVASIAANAKESKKEGDNYHAKQILIVGLHDNVKSNYFYNGMIAEETGMKADSIDQTYNTIIAENIAASVKNGDCKFIPANATQVTGQVLNEIKVNGESEDCHAAGDMLMYHGVKLKQAFGGTGYNNEVRYFQDFAARMYFMEEEKEHADSGKAEK